MQVTGDTPSASVTTGHAYICSALFGNLRNFETALRKLVVTNLPGQFLHDRYLLYIASIRCCVRAAATLVACTL